MGRPKGFTTFYTGRLALRSPGHPGVSYKRWRQQRFWEAIARGLSSYAAADDAGVSTVVGSRWFREAGGMRPSTLDSEPSPHFLSFSEREEIALLRAQEHGVREIARRLGRSASTISRELRRNAATRSGQFDYRASLPNGSGPASEAGRCTRGTSAKSLSSLPPAQIRCIWAGLRCAPPPHYGVGTWVPV